MSCSICMREIDAENAPIIAMGGFGHPRCICDGCAEKLDVMNTSLDTEAIRAAMREIADTMANNTDDDMVAHNAVKVILMEAGARVEKIENGTYTEEEEDDGMLDVPEELRETVEDRALDLQDEMRSEKLDGILNRICLGVFGLAIVALVVYFVFRFFL